MGPGLRGQKLPVGGWQHSVGPERLLSTWNGLSCQAPPPTWQVCGDCPHFPHKYKAQKS